jgi:hypothetical protein
MVMASSKENTTDSIVLNCPDVLVADYNGRREAPSPTYQTAAIAGIGICA